MGGRSSALAIAAGLFLALGAGPAGAHVPEGENLSTDPVDGPVHEDGHQHGGENGHLPASSKDVGLVSKLKLTDVPGGIADVGYHDGFAYLNAFSPECKGRPGAQGTGVHIVDVHAPKNPRRIGFLPAEENSYVGEGVHVIEFEGRDILLHNNETCNGNKHADSGVSVWDVTNPREPVELRRFGDTEPERPRQLFHTTHSVQGFTWNGRAYAAVTDNQDLKDVDIFDITEVVRRTGSAVLVAEQGLEDWPGAQTSYANGDNVSHHDMQQKVIDGHNFLAVSYWDAGQVLLNIDDPANPVFVGDSDYLSPDPQFPEFTQPEGNSHQSFWDQDGDWLLSTDEDFSPRRTAFAISDGPHAGSYGAGEFSWAKRLPAETGISTTSGSVWGGSGCTSDLNGNGTSDRDEVPSAASTGATVVAFSRGDCFFSDKVRSGEEAGYEVVLIGQSHGGTRDGLLRDGFACGGQGSPVLGTAHALCIGHRAMHLLFEDTPAYEAPEGYAPGGDMPAIGTLGASISAQPKFDGWGYVSLHDARDPDLPVRDTYAVAESKDPAFASGFGNLTVHEVKTDPRQGRDLAYFSYYDAGLRVAKFGPGGIEEVGHFIDEGGNDFWGVFPVCAAACREDGREPGRRDDVKRPLLLMSDRDHGLYVLRYTGQE